jgi:exodeoxyribonuclease III
MPVPTRFAESGREFILCGDWNIAHREIDLKNWRSNQKNSGFLPEERAWLTSVFERAEWVDVFRRLDSRREQYTWWSNHGQAWAKNVGWRIDYQYRHPRNCFESSALVDLHGQAFLGPRCAHDRLRLDYLKRKSLRGAGRFSKTWGATRA